MNERTGPKVLEARLNRTASKFRTAGGSQRLPLFHRLGELTANVQTTYGNGDVRRLARVCGWKATSSLYHAMWFADRVDRPTLRRMAAARKADGQPLFVVTDAKQLAGIRDERERAQAIDRAIAKRLSGKALITAVAERQGRTPGGLARNYQAPARTFEERTVETRALRARFDRMHVALDRVPELSAKDRKRAVQRLKGLAAEMTGLIHELQVHMRRVERTIRSSGPASGQTG